MFFIYCNKTVCLHFQGNSVPFLWTVFKPTCPTGAPALGFQIQVVLLPISFVFSTQLTFFATWTTCPSYSKLFTEIVCHATNVRMSVSLRRRERTKEKETVCVWFFEDGHTEETNGQFCLFLGNAPKRGKGPHIYAHTYTHTLRGRCKHSHKSLKPVLP